MCVTVQSMPRELEAGQILTKGKIGDNTERDGRGDTDQGGSEGGKSATIQRKGIGYTDQRGSEGEDPRQCREEWQRLYRSRGISGGGPATEHTGR